MFFGYYFGEIMCVGTAMSIRKVFFVVLFMKVMSVQLEGIVLSVQLEVVILQYIGWCVLVVWTFAFNQFSSIQLLLLLLLLLLLFVCVCVCVSVCARVRERERNYINTVFITYAKYLHSCSVTGTTAEGDIFM
jgi:ABC-type multidrug transport system permease subunit